MGTRLAALYVASVAIVTALHAATGVPAAASLALTPDRLAHGGLWELVTSAFLVAGPPVSQLLVLAVLAAVVIRRRGARTVDVHIRRLRAKLGQEHAARIKTIRNVGYLFEWPR